MNDDDGGVNDDDDVNDHEPDFGDGVGDRIGERDDGVDKMMMNINKTHFKWANFLQSQTQFSVSVSVSFSTSVSRSQRHITYLSISLTPLLYSGLRRRWQEKASSTLLSLSCGATGW